MKIRNLFLLYTLSSPFLLSAQTAETKAEEQLAGGEVAIQNLNVSKQGESMVIDMVLNLSELDIPANQRFVFTPMVKAGEQKALMNPVVVNGRRQQITYDRSAHRKFPKNTVSVRRKNGKEQTIHYTASVPYETWMNNANVALAEDLCGCGDVMDQHSVVLKRMRRFTPAFIRPAAEGQKDRFLKGSAFLDFPVDKTTLYPEYRNNPAELAKIINSIKVVKEDENTQITAIRIHGYASPESPYDHNAYLAENRAKMLRDYVSDLSGVKASMFTVESTPEDWAGLKKFVSESSLKNRDAILELIDSDMDPDKKEWKIKLTYPEDYRRMLTEVYPALRHSDYEIDYVIRAFTVEEAKQLLYTKPAQLSLEEMFLVAQTYEPGSPEFNEVFDIAVRMFPTDPVANANVAITLIERDDLAGAQRYLDRAGSSPEVLNARGILAARQGQTQKARELWQQAANAGLSEASENLRLLEVE